MKFEGIVAWVSEGCGFDSRLEELRAWILILAIDIEYVEIERKNTEISLLSLLNDR